MSDTHLKVRPGYGQLNPYTSQDALTLEKLEKGKVYDITIHGEKRSLDQNALQYAWYAQIAKEKGDSVKNVRCFCKLHYGVPILRSDSFFNEKYTKLILNRYSYEEKLELMEWLPVTSLMLKSQESQYLSDMQNHFAEEGIILESR